MFWEAEEISGKTWVLGKKMSKKQDEVKSTDLVID